MQFSLTTLFMSILLLFSEFSVALTADQSSALSAHNTPRAAKGINALVWDSTLTSQAQAYANELAATGKFQHSGVSGENLYWASAAGTTPLTSAVRSWMAEVTNYHGEIIPQGNFASYGHYTQCMWSSTTKVGIASAKDAKGGVYVVARYSPAGNIVGQKPYP